MPSYAGSSRFLAIRQRPMPRHGNYGESRCLGPAVCRGVRALSWTYWREAAFRWSADPQIPERALR